MAGFDIEALRPIFDRPEIVAAYVFGSVASGGAHALSDVALAYLAVDPAAEDRIFDALFESLQRECGPERFDLVPLRRAPLHLRFQIVTEGRRFLVRDPVRTESFEARAIVEYLDFKPHRERYFGRGA
jgi:predicted nucleotidyltransferase